METACLEISGPKGAGRLELNDRPITIGRHMDNALVLADDMASRFHCVIERVAGGFNVRDLDSRNGTKLNGQPVKASRLNNGDVVQIGRTALKLVLPNGNVAAVGADESPVDHGNPEQVLRRLADSLPDKETTEREIGILNARGKLAHAAPGSDPPSRKGSGEPGRDAVQILRLLLLVCYRIKATDIHIEPKNENYQVRLRVDGNMVEVVRLDSELGVKLSAVVKVLCDIDIGHRNIVQEGHFSTKVPGRRVDYRVSFAPAMFGQKLVIRILDTANAPFYIWDLQMPEWMQQEIEKAVQGDSGMVLVCGPTGSGKTTTLYACVRSIDSGERNVVTIEDPVEIQIEGVTQIPVNEQQGNTFSNLLRSVLRQDPDAILVGEVRDAETARIAMQAAMTGHLVFSTIHARDTISTVFRLLDLGIEPFLVGSGLHQVLAQRLVRQLCPYCKVPAKITAEQKQRLGSAGARAERIFLPGKCHRCLQTGYAGRRGLFELLTVNEAMREVILRGGGMQEIQQALGGSKFVKLQHSGYQLVADGLTSLEEIERVAG
jgi:general secretion pathway protein E